MIDVCRIKRKGKAAMNVKYSQIRTSRKAFVQIISDILEKPATYQGAPTFAYTIGNYSLDISGNLHCPDDADKATIKQLVSSLQKLGYTPDNYDKLFLESTDSTNTNDSLIIEIPRTVFTEQSFINLHKIVDSKSALLKLAIGTDSLDITTDKEKIYFPWFTLHGIEGETDAYSRLILAIAEMAKRQKRVISVEKPIENAKFSMRLFLVRLGFIGDEYKTARRILLRNLTGNSSWKAGKPPEIILPLEPHQTNPNTGLLKSDVEKIRNRGNKY